MTEQGQRSMDINACVDTIIERVGRRIVLGLPLGLGKPIHLANALYHRAREDATIDLHIVTAISPLVPVGKSSLEKRFLEPFVKRLYDGIPELDYARDVEREELPSNVRVSEFFFKAGSQLGNVSQQRHYISSNYTHVVRDLLAMGVNVAAQMVSPSEDGETLSMSCNPDVSLDLTEAFHEKAKAGERVMLVAETNRYLPYLGNDARVPATDFDLIYDRPSDDYPLFAVPPVEVSPADHLIGFYCSALIRDGGTLQVGIGSLGTSLVYNIILRHEQNAAWRAVFHKLNADERFPVIEQWGGTEPFEKGLYGCSEMLVDGFMHLLDAGILKREVFPNTALQRLLNEERIGADVDMAMLDTLREADLIQSPLRARDVSWLQDYGILKDDVVFRGGRLRIGDFNLSPDLDDAESRERLAAVALGERLKGGTVAHGGFYIGPSDFYDRLRRLTDEEASRLCMTSVQFINHLYDHRFGRQALKVAQRQESRFVNSAMMATLDGEVVSDGLDDGRVVSGVGGQYNFVAMAHELPRARSVMALRSTRSSGGKVKSNIVFGYGHCTIPRHLRDIVVTEYGIADLRGKPDEEVYLEMIRIADSRFQPELLKQAQKAGKVSSGFKLPDHWRVNTPSRVREVLAIAGEDRFPAYPFGSAFTSQEHRLVRALKYLRNATASRRGRLQTLWKASRDSSGAERFSDLLDRMGLKSPENLRDRLTQRVLLYGLRQTETH